MNKWFFDNWKSRRQGVFSTLYFMQVESSKKTEYSTLQNSYNGFQGTLGHQNSSCDHSKGCSKQYWCAKYRNQGQRSKQVQLLVTCKHVTIKSSSETNSTEAITNRFQLDKERSHGPTRSTRLKLSYKSHSLTFHSQISHCTLESNTHPQCKACLSCNSRTERHQPKRVADLQKEEEYTQPNHSGFSLNIGKRTPSSRQAVCVDGQMMSSFCLRKSSRSASQLTPFQMNTLQSLSVPKTTDRFTKTGQCTVSSLCPRMVQRVIHSQDQDGKCCGHRPNI